MRTETEEVEIKTVNALTERPDAEKGWKCRLLNGPRRALRNGTEHKDPEYGATLGMRQLHRICWYPIRALP